MLINAERAERTTAVVLEDEVISLRGIVRYAVINERPEHIRIRHELVLGFHRRALRPGNTVRVEKHKLARILMSVHAFGFPDLVVCAADDILAGFFIRGKPDIVRIAQISAFQMPLIGTGVHDDKIHVIVRAEIRVQDLAQIDRRISAGRFQIRSTVVHQDRALRDDIVPGARVLLRLRGGGSLSGVCSFRGARCGRGCQCRHDACHKDCC